MEGKNKIDYNSIIGMKVFPRLGCFHYLDGIRGGASLRQRRNKGNRLRVSLVVVAAILLNITFRTYSIQSASAANVYWLHSTEARLGSSISSGKMWCRGNKIQINGTWQKARKESQIFFTEKKARSMKKTFRLDKKCKVIEMEMPKDHVYSWKRYKRIRGYKKGDRIGYVEGYLKIVNGKIKRIYFSA